MKLDNTYFEKKAATLGWCQDGNIPAIIKQIARDAAEAQREKCFEWCRLKLLDGGCSACDSALAIPDGE